MKKLAACAALLMMAACHRPTTAPPRPVRRIVSLAPSSTEILYALGVGDRVVGVDQYSDWPPAAAAVPRVGSDLNPSVERILALYVTANTLIEQNTLWSWREFGDRL